MLQRDNIKTGILGGTFDPVHLVHLLMCRTAMRELCLDRIMLVPDNIPSHKAFSNAVSNEDRLNMLETAVRELNSEFYYSEPNASGYSDIDDPWSKSDRYFVSDIDIRRGGLTFTADTLRELKKSHPDNDYFFIVGSDSFLNMTAWHEPEVIFKLADIVVFIRLDLLYGKYDETKRACVEKKKYYEEQFGAEVTLLDLDCPDEMREISSSKIRGMIYKGLDVSAMLPEGVCKYIKEHGLYSSASVNDNDGLSGKIKEHDVYSSASINDNYDLSGLDRQSERNNAENEHSDENNAENNNSDENNADKFDDICNGNIDSKDTITVTQEKTLIAETEESRFDMKKISRKDIDEYKKKHEDEDELAVLEGAVKMMLKRKRFIHTQGVRYTAACLAFRYGADIRKAQIAGILHDCAKNLDDETMLKECDKYGVIVTDIEKEAPYLLHAKLGAAYAEKLFGVEDPDILNAIRWHTTGKDNMDLLEKIIFIADYIEPNRKLIPGIMKARSEVFSDLDRAVLTELESTLSYLDKRDEAGSDTKKKKIKAIEPNTLAAYNYYKEKCNG